jgi:hypothetical protein
MPKLGTDKKQTIAKVIEATIEDFNAQATENREKFRETAAQAYEAFGDADRKISRQLQTKDISIHDILDTWKQGLQGVRQALDERQQDNQFARYLADNLFLSLESAREKITQLTTAAAHEFLQQVVQELYPESTKTAHEKQQVARAFLSQPEIAIDDFYQRYVAFAAAVESAKRAKITIYDSMATWVERQRTLSTIKKERHQTLKQQRERLNVIDHETAKLRQLNDNLLDELLEHQWDPFVIQNLYQAYKDHLAELPKKEQHSPTKLLHIFDTVTADFRDQEVQKMSDQTPHMGLNGLRQLSEEINKLLLRFFDLSDNEKQALLEGATAYQDLEQEKASIKQLQQLFAKHAEA